MLINDEYVCKNLSILDKEYRALEDDYVDERKILFGKLALLELCGWLEDTMDEIILGLCEQVNLENRKPIEKAIKNTYGFSYEHFEKMLVTLIGYKKLEWLEKEWDKQPLCNKLGSLKNRRDDFAHTHTKETNVKVDAPNILLKEQKELKKIFNELIAILWKLEG